MLSSSRFRSLQSFTRVPRSKSEQGASLEQRRHRGVHFQSLFLHRLSASIRLASLRSALRAAALSEAEGIVFAAEGLLLPHEFSFNCGIRDQPRTDRVRRFVQREEFVRTIIVVSQKTFSARETLRVWLLPRSDAGILYSETGGYRLSLERSRAARAEWTVLRCDYRTRGRGLVRQSSGA
jgi:hypothetical protein